MKSYLAHHRPEPRGLETPLDLSYCQQPQWPASSCRFQKRPGWTDREQGGQLQPGVTRVGLEIALTSQASERPTVCERYDPPLPSLCRRRRSIFQGAHVILS